VYDPDATMTERPEDQERAGVSLARYAEISAELRVLGRERTAEILSRAGLRPDDWEQADASWKAALDGDLDGKAGLLLAFTARFSATRRRLASAPAGDTQTTAQAPAARPEPEPEAAVHEAEASLPTYLHGQGSKPPGPSPTLGLGLADAPPNLLAPLLESPASIPSAASPGRSLAATEELDVHAIVSRILPFDPGKSAPPTGAATAPASKAKPSGATVELVMPKDLVPEPASVASGPPARAPAALVQTADLDIHHIVSKLMPFGAKPAPTPEPARAAPAPPTGAPDFRELTLEQYASLTAEIATTPERAAPTCARYGVPTEQAYRALHALWERRFAEDATLQERWVRLVGEYRAWLQQQGR
jgi:hypothetical protein